MEWTGGQIKDDDSAQDIKTVDLKAVHIIQFSMSHPTPWPAPRCKRCRSCRDHHALASCNCMAPYVCSSRVQVHYLSGPINVKDAEGKLAQPGDLLAVELCNLGPLPGQHLGLHMCPAGMHVSISSTRCAR